MSITFQTFINGVLAAEGDVPLDSLGARELPDSVAAGTIQISDRGTHIIEVILSIDGNDADSSRKMQSFSQGTSIIPLLVVLGFAVATRMVEFSLFTAIFVGACMITGNVNTGFKMALDTYLVKSVADEGHAFVVLFTLFLSGMVSMLEKSGGLKGFVQSVAKYATTSRSAQMVTYGVGLLVFFDDYANTLLAGETMRPLTDLLFVSREKLAFIVDATAAPIASLTPISSWVGFELSLIDAELERLKDKFGEEDLTIKTSAMGVFLQSIKYRYYPIFMIILMPLLIWFRREFGPMLIAERKTQVYERTDGGDGRMTLHEGKEGEEKVEVHKPNQPRNDIPQQAFNMLLPICALIILIFYLLVASGDDGSGDQSILDKIEAGDSYVALLYGTFAAAVLTLLFFLGQIVDNGMFVVPTMDVLKAWFFSSSEQEEGSGPRSLMTVFDSIEAFLYGMGRIFPALIVLILAWASGAIMVDVGVGRLFSSWIVGGISPSSLPTLSFIISAFMALATGTSWSTMTILFPLLLVPTYEASGGDELIFYAVVAGILSGSVTGDHVSPISDTTVLSSLASDCKLLAHVSTQAPYTTVVIIISIALGTAPIGNDTWPNIIGILLGILCLVLFTFFVCKPVINADGNLDIITELILKFRPNEELDTLKEDTRNAFAERETLSPENEDGKELEEMGDSPSSEDDADAEQVEA